MTPGFHYYQKYLTSNPPTTFASEDLGEGQDYLVDEQQQNLPRLKLLLDACIEPETYIIINDLNDKYLGFFGAEFKIEVFSVHRMGMSRASDQEIIDYAFEHNMVILTHDKDFGPGRIELDKCMGVIIVPDSMQREAKAGTGDFHDIYGLAYLLKAIEDFFVNMPMEAESWRGKIAKYKRGGQINIYRSANNPLRPYAAMRVCSDHYCENLKK